MNGSFAFPKVIAVDANFLIAHAHANTTDEDKSRIDYLLKRTEEYKSQLVIPMPALAEYLVRADEAALEILNLFEKKSCVYCAPFDRMAAYECALIDKLVIATGHKKNGQEAPYQKIKVDRQIVAIAKSLGVKLLITGDGGLRSTAQFAGIKSMLLQDLELPHQQQHSLL